MLQYSTEESGTTTCELKSVGLVPFKNKKPTEVMKVIIKHIYKQKNWHLFDKTEWLLTMKKYIHQWSYLINWTDLSSSLQWSSGSWTRVSTGEVSSGFIIASNQNVFIQKQFLCLDQWVGCDFTNWWIKTLFMLLWLFYLNLNNLCISEKVFV